MRDIRMRGWSRRPSIVIRWVLALALFFGDALLMPVRAVAQLEALTGQLEALGIDPSALQQTLPGSGLPVEAGIPSSPRQTDLELSTANLSGSPALVSGAEVQELSPIEADYERRAARGLRQIGYDSFVGAVTAGSVSGAVWDDYVLGIGDELIVTLRGQVNQIVSARIDREGRITFPDLPPILGAGRRFGDFRDELQTRIREAFLSTEAFVSLGAVRTISVVVTGEVAQPGIQALTSFSSVIDALAVAGGVKRTGSLRNVYLVRQGESIAIDLYEFLLGGITGLDIRLQDGDRLTVPTIGRTVAVAGDAVRPGIFELPPDAADEISIAEVLDYAGGPVRPTGNRFTVLRLDDIGQDRVIDLGADIDARIRAADIVMIGLLQNLQVGSVTVSGNVTVGGQRSLSDTGTLRALISNPPILSDETYMLFGVIETTDPETRIRKFIPVNFNEVLDGRTNVRLRDRDRLIVLSREDIRFLGSDVVQQYLAGTQTAAAGCPGLRSLAEALRNDASGRFANARQTVQPSEGGLRSERSCPAIFATVPDLLPYIIEHVVSVEGQVRLPGSYPIIPGTGLGDLLAATGGTTIEADDSAIEIGYFSTEAPVGTQGTWQTVGQFSGALSGITLSPGDTVRVPQDPQLREEGTVVLAGEFQHPGRYVVRRGETLSELIRRAGGYTNDAYPYGAVFARDRVRRDQQAGFDRAARELQSSLPSLTQQNVSDRAEAEALGSQVAVVQGLIAAIRATPAVGRVVIEADPTVLQARPELDFILESGDQLVVPKRPLYVTVSGEVLNSGTLQFRGNLTAEDFIRLSGGTTEFADLGRAFIVLPNGQAEPLSLSSWSYSTTTVPPGSSIIVPRDLTPFNFLSTATDILTLLSDIAVTIASAIVIAGR